MAEYNFDEIENKWQSVWLEKESFKASEDYSKRKYYVLIEFPYPSGEGLHIGHPRSYVALDIVARKRRMEGFNVLYPMGWDAFGLPAENYAIKTKQHPRDITLRNIANFRRMMQRLGLSFDWSREVDTTDPEYYKWTQWMFIQMWKHGLAYKSEIPVNWCESCKVGLANEEVVGGKCERCGGTVTQKNKQQWMLRITVYADRLLKDLDTVDYLDKIKAQQTNWIGRSEGGEISFTLNVTGKTAVKVFTTRPDTLFGVTYMVLSPEHELISGLLPYCRNQEQILAYVAQAREKSFVERTEVTKEVSGVPLDGITAVNPATGKEVPVWISDYVLASYGTGAIMAVPGHDERDWRFAKRFGLPIIEVVSGGNIEEAAFTDIDQGLMVNSGPLNGLKPSEAIGKMIAIMREGGYGQPKVQYKLRDWVFSRQRFWGEPIPMVYCAKCGWVPVPESELPVKLPEVKNYQPTATGESPLAQIPEWVNVPCPKCQGPGKRETDTMPQWAGSSWYYLRYCDPHNSVIFADRKKLDYWMPVDWYNGGMEHTTLHLLYSRFWYKFLYDIKMVPTPEPYQKRTSHGLVLGENGEKMSKSRGNVINPGDVIKEYGADALRLYEVFMGDFDQPIPWSNNGLVGMSRFLQRVWRLEDKVGPQSADRETSQILHQTIKEVSERVEILKFNTALAALMELANHFSGITVINNEVWKTFLKLLSPFAPHIGEELWAHLGISEMLCSQPWPVFDPAIAEKETIEVPVQVNGKLRKRLLLSKGLADEEVKAQAIEAAAAYTAGQKVLKIILIRRPSSILVNIVV
jgi:leucyl-tRNA synthetase